MLNISISAIKGGYKELHQTTPNAPIGIASAIRSDSGSPFAVGKEAFVISFTKTGVVFTKCKIIRDGLAASRVGNIAISILIPLRIKMAGKNIFTLLSKILDSYTLKYIDKDNNLGDVYEDWGFVDEILRNYDDCLMPSSDDNENLSLGSEKGAFIYYSSQTELEKFLDNPYQEEFLPFSKIFLVENHLQGKSENPLNALQHDPSKNLTGKIDLENPKYKLKYFNTNGKHGVTIEIWGANSQKLYDKSTINRKDTVRIRYSKPHYVAIDVTGKLTDENICKYLTVTEDNKVIVNNDIQLDEETREIVLYAQDRSGNTIPNLRFTCLNTTLRTSKEVENNKVVFKGEELKDVWSISAETGNLKAQPITIIPKESNGNVHLTLKKYVVVIFDIRNSEGVIENATIEIKNKNITPGQYEVEFVDKEIEENWIITVSHKNYEKNNFYYCPAKDENPKTINLTKKSDQANPPAKPSEASVTSNPATEQPKQKHYSSKKIAFALGGVLSVGLIFWAIFSLFRPSSEDPYKDILSYVNGVELKKSVLDSLNTQYCNSTDGEDAALWKKIFNFGSDAKGNTDYCIKIKIALEIRSAITQGSIDKLGNIDYYSRNHYSFKQSINRVDNKYRTKISETLRDSEVSKMDLNSIADLLDDYQKLLRIEEVVSTITEENKLTDKRNEIKGISSKSIKIIDSLKTKINSEIDEKLGGGDPTTPKQTPATPKQTPATPKQTPTTQTPCVDEFWRLVQNESPQIQKEDFDNWFNDCPLSDGDNEDYKNFYNHYLKYSDNFEKFKNIRPEKRKATRSLNALKNLLNQ